MKTVLRSLATTAILAISAAAFTEESWFGIYMDGQKIGYTSSSEVPEPNQQSLKKVSSDTVILTKLMDTTMEIRVKSESVVNANGRPISMRYETLSSGRRQLVTATFGAKTISAVIDNNGQKSTRTIPIPAGAVIVDDATTAVMRDEVIPVGKTAKVLVLDPTTITLMENKVTAKGTVSVDVRGLLTKAQLIEIADSRSVTKVYLSSKGDLVKIEAPLGMVMLPETKAIATDLTNVNGPDLGALNAITVSPAIDRSWDTRQVTFNFTGIDLTGLPSDKNQTVAGKDQTWTVTVHPNQPSPNTAKPLSQVSVGREGSIGPGLHMPSDQKRFITLAQSILKGETNSAKAAALINNYVGRLMSVDASIGVLRDANEVLDTKKGVCRDYAILTCTLMRAAKIPARLCSGVIYDSGRLYYHAWVEAWDGFNWIPYDATRYDRVFDATHIKISHGNVEEAFTFKVLSGATVTATEVQYREQS